MARELRGHAFPRPDRPPTSASGRCRPPGLLSGLLSIGASISDLLTAWLVHPNSDTSGPQWTRTTCLRGRTGLSAVQPTSARLEALSIGRGVMWRDSDARGWKMVLLARRWFGARLYSRSPCRGTRAMTSGGGGRSLEQTRSCALGDRSLPSCPARPDASSAGRHSRANRTDARHIRAAAVPEEPALLLVLRERCT